MPLDPHTRALDASTLDHVAVAVADLAAAEAHWEGLGGAPLPAMRNPGFATRQLRLANHGKVELIGTGSSPEPSFIDGYLQRFGSGRIHHLTLKVPAPLSVAVERLEAAGLDVVDFVEVNEFWHECFLRPSQVGGVIVQVAWAGHDDEGFARELGLGALPAAGPTAPALERVVLGHHDLGHAAALWRTLGADISEGGDHVVARWSGAPVALEIRKAASDGPLGLVFTPTAVAARTDLSPALLEPGD